MAEIKFLLGTEEGEKQNYLEAEKKRLRQLHPDLEIITFFAFDTDAGDLEEALFSSSLFSAYSLVIIKHYEEAAKDSPINKVIMKFISSGSETASLIVISNQTNYSLPSAISKALKKDQMIVFWEMFENQKQDWIRSFFRKEGWTVTNDAIRYILDMIENNTSEMKDCCSQLALYFNLSQRQDRRIDIDDISAFLSHTKNEDAFSLFAVIAKAELGKALSCLHKIMTSDARAYMSLVPVLLRQFRLLESYMTLLQTESEDKAFENASALTSGAPARGIRSVRDKQTFRTAKSHYTPDQVSAVICYLDEMDIKVRSAGTDEVMLTLELMLYTIIVNKGKESPVRLERELFDNAFSYRNRN